ncbi:MAG TPA: hypothetical protein VFE24_17920 [Pirellulales bacterium]|jgi:hypothetical protein|nr:hypothetical protein [Pirellulales bacterium]
MNPISRRRWFQFSLRTLLILVALAAAPCVYVTQQQHLVRERRAFVAAHPECYFAETTPGPQSNWLRARLGDTAYGLAALPLDSSLAQREGVAELFPEASLMAINPRNPRRPNGGGASSRFPPFIPFPPVRAAEP